MTSAYPDIVIESNDFDASLSSLFLPPSKSPTDHNLLRNTYRTIKSEGLLGALCSQGGVVGQTLATWLFGVSPDYFYQDIKKKPPVKFLTWHPCTSLLAVAHSDDVVSIHNLTAPTQSHAKIKHRLQQHTVSLKWAPHSPGTLAVCCSRNILVWRLHPHSGVPLPGAVKVFGFHSQVLCLEWHPRLPSLLAACVKGTDDLHLLHTSLDLRTLVTGSGGTMMAWSQSDATIATITTRIRGNLKLSVHPTLPVWRHLTSLSGKVALPKDQEAVRMVWSPLASLLVIISSTSGLITCLSPECCIIVYDLHDSISSTQHLPSTHDPENDSSAELPHKTFFRVTDLSFNSAASLLAVALCFEANSESAQINPSKGLVVFLRTLSQPFTHHFSYYSENVDEYPVSCQFSQGFSSAELANVTAVAWSSGRISFVNIN